MPVSQRQPFPKQGWLEAWGPHLLPLYPGWGRTSLISVVEINYDEYALVDTKGVDHDFRMATLYSRCPALGGVGTRLGPGPWGGPQG